MLTASLHSNAYFLAKVLTNRLMSSLKKLRELTLDSPRIVTLNDTNINLLQRSISYLKIKIIKTISIFS